MPVIKLPSALKNVPTKETQLPKDEMGAAKKQEDEGASILPGMPKSNDAPRYLKMLPTVNTIATTPTLDTRNPAPTPVPDRRSSASVLVSEAGESRASACSALNMTEINEELSSPAKKMIVSVNSVLNGLRNYSTWSLYLAGLGLVLNMAQREVAYSQGSGTNTEIALRALTSISTMGLLFCIYKYHHNEFLFTSLNRVFMRDNVAWHTDKIWEFCIDCLVCIIHEPPGWDVEVEISLSDNGDDKHNNDYITMTNPWGMLMVLRMYLLLRYIRHRYYTGGSHIVGIWHNFEFSNAFTIRNLLFERPGQTLIPLYSFSLFVCSWYLLICERAAQPNWSFYTSFWVTIMSLTGIGFGDTHPVTILGRLTVILFGLFFLCGNAVLIASVNQWVSLKPYETRMVEFLQQTHVHKLMQINAVKVIEAFWRLKKAQRRRSNMARILLYRFKLQQSTFEFQHIRKEGRSFYRHFQSNQMFRIMLEKLELRLDRIGVTAEDDSESDEEEPVPSLVRRRSTSHHSPYIVTRRSPETPQGAFGLNNAEEFAASTDASTPLVPLGNWPVGQRRNGEHESPAPTLPLCPTPPTQSSPITHNRSSRALPVFRKNSTRRQSLQQQQQQSQQQQQQQQQEAVTKDLVHAMGKMMKKHMGSVTKALVEQGENQDKQHKQQMEILQKLGRRLSSVEDNVLKLALNATTGSSKNTILRTSSRSHSTK